MLTILQNFCVISLMSMKKKERRKLKSLKHYNVISRIWKINLITLKKESIDRSSALDVNVS